MWGYNLKPPLTFLLLLLLLLVALSCWSSRLGSCNAKPTFVFNKKERGYGGLGRRYGSRAMLSFIDAADKFNPTPEPSGRESDTFNVLDYGAKGDGKTDDTEAFQAAWEDACSAKELTLLVPAGSVFLVGPITFSGPDCKPNMIFQLEGEIIAPTSPEAWGSGLLQWLEFKNLQGLMIKGSGTVDGQGSVWWNNDSLTYDLTDDDDGSITNSSQKTKGSSSRKMPSTKPTAVRFYGSDTVTVTGITIQNSQQTHLKFDACTNVRVFTLTTSSPGDSPNTDGIHLQNSQNVLIYNTNLACGADCISIQTGCSNINIHNINCGPGHGISIGGLGKGDTQACVSNVTVSDTKIQNALTGVRIKTWQGGSGSVKGVTFSNIQVSNVNTPIMIDQFYCDGTKCKNNTSAVAIKEVKYVNIQGTYTKEPVHLACSDSSPCSDLLLDTIKLTPSEQMADPLCWKAYGELKSSTVPPIDCLESGSPSRDKNDDGSCYG